MVAAVTSPCVERRGSHGPRSRLGVALAVVGVFLFLLAAARATPLPPAAVLRADDLTPFVGEPVRFDASSSEGHDEGNGRIVGFLFRPGDGTEAGWQGAPYFDHAYAATGLYRASVLVRDARGLQSAAALEIRVRDPLPPTGEAPDLAIVQGSTDPPKPELDDVVRAYVTVANRGGTAAVAATVDFFDGRPGGSEIEIGSVDLADPLGVGDLTVVVSPAFLALEEGAHELRVLVRDVAPAETFTDDNERLVPMTVARPTVPPVDGPRDGFAVDPVVLGLAVAAGASLLAAAVFLTRPRPPSPLEPPSHVPPDRTPPPIWPP